MCQAIVKPAGEILTKNMLHTAWCQNPDGAGFAYLQNKQVTIERGFFHFKEFWKSYRQYQHLDCLIHFRLATHGPRSVNNCHPFTIADGAMVHNGILDKFLPFNNADIRSDSLIFTERYLVPLLSKTKFSLFEFLTDEVIQQSITLLIGCSKLAFLTPEGFVIYNKEYGQILDSVWFSAGIPTATTFLNWNIPYCVEASAVTSYGDGWSDADIYDEYMCSAHTPAPPLAIEQCDMCFADVTDGACIQVGVDRMCNRCYDVLTT